MVVICWGRGKYHSAAWKQHTQCNSPVTEPPLGIVGNYGASGTCNY